MKENIFDLGNNIHNLANENKIEDINENQEEKNEEQQLFDCSSTSTSTSGMSQYNDNIGIQSKLNLENLKQHPNQRKLSAPVRFPGNEEFILKFIKIGRDTRGEYYNKLITKGFLNKPNNENKFKANNIFIFDWDDTLLCTSVLTPRGYFDDNMIILPSKIEKIKKLEILVIKILTIAIDKGDTYIITNSEPGWVEYSCERFFPNTFYLLSKIKIISARGLYENKYPRDFKTWKIIAFREIIKNYEKNLPTNIICLGDSTYEMEAAHNLKGKFQNGFIKAIKFRESPNVDELINQLNIVIEKFNFIYSACKNWTITVIKKKKRNNKEK
jgi:hypothetical protein